MVLSSGHTAALILNAIDFANIRQSEIHLFTETDWYINSPNRLRLFSRRSIWLSLVVNVLNWKAAVGHTVGGNTTFHYMHPKPFYLSVNVNDNHPQCWPCYNAQAEQNISKLYRWVYAPFSTSLMLKPTVMQKIWSVSSYWKWVFQKSIFQELKKNNDLDEEIICAHRLMLWRLK